MTIDANRNSSLLEQLPAVFREDCAPGAPSFLGRFLLGFEQLLLGLDGAGEPGLEQLIAGLGRYCEPGAALADDARAPAEFLHWLARWVALTLREDWDEQRQRDLIARAVSLYRLRGTRRGVEEFLRIYTKLGPSIDEFDTALQIGAHSTVGVDTLLDGGAPFYFRVRLRLPKVDLEQMRRQSGIARAIIDLQKPAHTCYDLKLETPTFRIAVNSTVGVDTLLSDNDMNTSGG